jgi:hypothetical protein
VLRARVHADTPTLVDQPHALRCAALQPMVCVVQVSDEGVRRIDANTFESRMFSHSMIACTHVVHERFLVMYLANGGKSNTLAMVFECIGRRADDITRGIKRGVDAAELRRKADPFAAIGGRESAPKSLFAKQVSRAVDRRETCYSGSGCWIGFVVVVWPS